MRWPLHPGQGFRAVGLEAYADGDRIYPLARGLLPNRDGTADEAGECEEIAGHPQAAQPGREAHHRTETALYQDL